MYQPQQRTKDTGNQTGVIRMSISLQCFKGTIENLRLIITRYKKDVFCKWKNTVATKAKNNIVYEIYCSNCQALRFGEARLSLKSSSDKQRRSVKNCDYRKNQIATYCWEADQKVVNS